MKKYLENYIQAFAKEHHINDIDSFIDGMKFYRELLEDCKGRECLDLLNCLDAYQYSTGYEV